MRRLAPLLLLLAACADDAPPASTGLADPEALRLLESVGAEVGADAFEALSAGPYTASVRVEVLDADGSTVGTETATLRVEGERVVVADRTVTGALDAPDDLPRLRDPLPATIPEDPPYLDPAAREAYRFAVVGDTTVAGRRLRLVEAALADASRRHAVQRVRAAVDPASGRAASVEVVRAADAAVYDETSRVIVDLWPVDGDWLPRRVVTDTRTAVPFSEARRVRTEWTVTDMGGRPLAADTTGG